MPDIFGLYDWNNILTPLMPGHEPLTESPKKPYRYVKTVYYTFIGDIFAIHIFVKIDPFL